MIVIIEFPAITSPAKNFSPPKVTWSQWSNESVFRVVALANSVLAVGLEYLGEGVEVPWRVEVPGRGG